MDGVCGQCAGPARHALIVAGPTASGKSALALAIAQRLGGVVINADSMQVYAELRILTARPSPADEMLAPHALYGVRPAAEAGNVAWWRAAALDEMDRAHAARRLPILCGGTGLYLAALTEGLATIPPPSDAARAAARRLLAEAGPEAVHAALAAVDPATAARLQPRDGQRLARAWEVWLGTGRGLADWQSAAAAPAPWRFTAIRLDPPRPALREAIVRRGAAMLRGGVLAEVAQLLEQDPDPTLPAMRACGMAALSLHVRGLLPLDEAMRRLTVATGQYAKRQATWFRHRELARSSRTHMIHARIAGLQQYSESELGQIIAFIHAAT